MRSKGQAWGNCSFNKGQRRTDLEGKDRRKPQSLAPLPRTSPLPMAGRGTKLGKEKKQPELSNKRAPKILIRDEMCSCLCTTHFPPQWRALSSTGCFYSAACPRGNEGSLCLFCVRGRLLAFTCWEANMAWMGSWV